MQLRPADVRVAPPAARRPSVAEQAAQFVAAARPVENALGALAPLSLIMALGVLVIAIAGYGSRAGQGWAEALFWFGLAIVVVPLLWRLISGTTSDHERLGLIMVFGIALYLVKVLHSPIAFTFPDEYVQVHIAQDTVQTQRLFAPNSINPVSSLYPGLASATSALVTLTGLSPFAAGILLIGVTRLVVLVAMYLLLSHISGSSRLAAITTAIYTANPNFLFYSAEFGYEQLALPLAAIVIVAVVVRLTAHDRSEVVGWTLVGFIALEAVVVTHHLTAYGIVGVLWVVCLLFAVYSRQPQRAPWDLALLGLVGALTWLVLVASPTITYLQQILGGALASAVQLILTHQAGRQLFGATNGGSVTPLWHQILGVVSQVMIVVALPYGLWLIWRSHRHNVFAVLLGIAALAYPPIQLLRLTQFGWETATRSSEFLFVGVGFVLALVLLRLEARSSPRRLHLAAPVFAIYISILFAGGVVAGWRADLLLPRAYLVSGGGPAIEPEGVTDSRWSLAALGPGHVFAADPSTAQLLMTFGEQNALTGDAHGIRDVIFATRIDPSIVDALSAAQVRYVAVDRRRISWVSIVGIYPPRPGDDPDQLVFLGPNALGKWDQQPGVLRILDSGNIVMYDVGVLSGATGTH